MINIEKAHGSYFNAFVKQNKLQLIGMSANIIGTELMTFSNEEVVFMSN